MANLPTMQETATFIDEALRNAIDPNATGSYDNSPGSDNAALITVLTKVATELYAYAADRKAASLPKSSTGDDTDAIVEDVFFDGRQDATAAVTTVYMQRTGTAATFISQGDRFSTQATDSEPAVEYEASTTVPVPLAQTYVAVPVRCLQEGAVGDVALQAINQILDQLDDSTWQLYVPTTGDPVLSGNPAADQVGGGQDRETDDQVKARVFTRTAQAAPGTKAGVYKGATIVPGIATAVPVEPGDGTGIIYAGDQNYLLPQAMQQQLLTSLEDWRPFGVSVAARPMNVVTVQVTGVIHMQEALSTYDQNALAANAVAAVLAYFKTGRKHPDEYYLDQLQGAIGSANAGTQSVVLSAPSANQPRPADNGYGNVVSLTRYVVSATSIKLQFAGPLTT